MKSLYSSRGGKGTLDLLLFRPYLVCLIQIFFADWLGIYVAWHMQDLFLDTGLFWFSMFFSWNICYFLYFVPILIWGHLWKDFILNLIQLWNLLPAKVSNYSSQVISRFKLMKATGRCKQGNYKTFRFQCFSYFFPDGSIWCWVLSVEGVREAGECWGEEDARLEVLSYLCSGEYWGY